jgi:endonuclease YncB( thermonuclease family)
VIGIHTPETVHPSVPDECGGQAASALANRLLNGRQVRLVFDASQGRTDAYDRRRAPGPLLLRPARRRFAGA